eukprot:CAMPEP_0113576392 /NCGR_PEP_ID=MMETSP0015_2-20120614/28273_1 /TAXON_ID=2838 /ORGANISM="Odontella" /LENGTH=147 /DNA_ID=CAMNT_0000479827 /DNA_START=229 /DNA_END=672 /DNA_ORIENTATION=+ /assembly_acc=CAM_ASM_000160
MQKPWAGFLLSEEKKIETRAYGLPISLIGKRIEVLESQPGQAGVSKIGDVVDGGEREISILVTRPGWCTFSGVIEYKDRESFESDEEQHLVKNSSGYGWKDGKTDVIYGWIVGSTGVYDKKESSATNTMTMASITRRMRSLYEIEWE